MSRTLLKDFVYLILAYLALVHFTGFARDIGALGQFVTGSARAFQGR